MPIATWRPTRGSLSLDEVQEAHARIFRHVDADNDDQVTLVEMQAFFRGTSSVAAQAWQGDIRSHWCTFAPHDPLP
jgi:hypothetical protein